MARTTAHAIMTDGDGAFRPFFFFAASRALRIASQRAPICRLAGMTRLSLRVTVGESAGSITVAGIADPGSFNAVSDAIRSRSPYSVPSLDTAAFTGLRFFETSSEESILSDH